MQQPTVVAVIDDLFFQAKVSTALQQMGIAVQVVPDGGPPAGPLAGRQCSGPGHRRLDAARRRRDFPHWGAAGGAARGDSVHILAFGSHVAVEVRKQALQAGASQVVAKSEFARHLPKLVRQFVPQIDENPAT